MKSLYVPLHDLIEQVLVFSPGSWWLLTHVQQYYLYVKIANVLGRCQFLVNKS